MLLTLYLCSVSTLFTLPCIANTLYLGTGTPIALNSTNKPNTTFHFANLVNITNTLETIKGCFHQAPPTEPQLLPTNFVDCFNAANQIAADDTYEPMTFRRDPDATFALPNSFEYRTCRIHLDMVSAEAEDFFYVGQIRDVAIAIARRCTALAKARGGVGFAGPRQLMEVLVLGRV